MRAADSWHNFKGLNTRKVISPSDLSVTNGFYSIAWLASAQVLSGVLQVQLYGYLFVYGVSVIVISFPDRLTAFVAPSSTSFSITFCSSLLLLG